MIEVFASRLSDEGKELYRTRKPQTILDWLQAHGIDEGADIQSLPMSVYLNGERLLPAQWSKSVFKPKDRVEIYREPKGTDPFSITFALIFGAKAAVQALMPKLPTASTRSNRSGRGLDEATAKGNKVKLNSIRPECFGRNPARYPDYLIEARRYFAGPREQRIEMCLAVGVGRYQIPPSKVKTGQTPLLSLGNDARFKVYEPGADLSADPAHLHWYSAPEVGASASGSAGLEMTVTTALTRAASASVFQFVDDTVTIPEGAGSFPADWVDGLLVRIGAPYPYTVADGTGANGRDVISGDIAQLGFSVGDTIEIAGGNDGTYVVHSLTATTMQLNYEAGTPATGLNLGNLTMAIGYPGMRYRMLVSGLQTIQVERLKTNGAADTAWPGWTSRSANQAQVALDPSNLAGGYRGPFPACPEGELITAIEWDVYYTTLIGIGREGQEFAIGSAHHFEYRDMALNGPWTVIEKGASGASMDSLGFTFRVDLPYPMRPECRIKKIATTFNRPNEIKDDCMWYGLRGLMPASSKTSYEGMTVLTCDIRGGDRISSQAESLVSVECTRYLPVLRNGQWQPEQPTREISAACGYILRNVGYSDTQDMDIAEFERLESTRWTPRGEFYDKVITDQDTVKGYLIEILNAGHSELTIDHGVLTPVRDEPRGLQFDHIYNPRVMLKPMKREFVAPDLPDKFDGVDVEYFDHTTKQKEVMKCRMRLPNGKLEDGLRVKTVKLEGVGDSVRVWRYGMRVRRGLIYRQKSYEFETELSGLNSSYFDYAGLGDSTPGYGQNAEIVGYAPMGGAVMLESSVRLDWSKDGQHLVLIRRRDGTASGPYQATRIDDTRFTVPSLDFVPDLGGEFMPPIIQFGHKDRWIYPALITEVQPRGTRTCQVQAVNYDERVFLDDDNFPPA